MKIPDPMTDRDIFFRWVADVPATQKFKFRANRHIGTADKTLFLKAGTTFIAPIGMVRTFLTIWGISHMPEHNRQERPALEILLVL